MSVVTYDELFQLIIIFISFAGLIYQITKEVTAVPSSAVTSFVIQRG
ncbi:MAG: hypothetical protein ACLSHU_09165 [Oscillospiraceae bacterium]